jgi:fluoride exporter
MFNNFLLVGLGGAVGSVMRYTVAQWMGQKTFPAATLLVNIVGSFIIGAVLALSVKNQQFANNWKLFLATGICGGFTTFSAFSIENMQLLQQGKYWLCLLYIGVSLVAGIAAAFVGYKLIN